MGPDHAEVFVRAAAARRRAGVIVSEARATLAHVRGTRELWAHERASEGPAPTVAGLEQRELPRPVNDPTA